MPRWCTLASMATSPISFSSELSLALFWTGDPVGISLPPIPSILPPASAIQRIYEHRFSADPKLLWTFTNGSVDGTQCGAAVVLFHGSSTASHPFSVRFEGLHSSTQAGLVAIHLGCQKASALGRYRHLIIVSNSQPALQAIQPLPRHWRLGTPGPRDTVYFAVRGHRPSTMVDPSSCGCD